MTSLRCISGRFSTLALLALLASFGDASAAPGAYTLVQDDSELRFIARQQGAPFTGRFGAFSANVQFDPAQPQDGQIRAEVDVRSADSKNRDRDEYMQARDFFYSRKYPNATFETTAIGPAPGDEPAYVAQAKLTLRGKTREVTMRFTFEQTAGEGAHLRGSVLLNRLEFGIGQGEWRDTSEIGDEVRVEIELALVAGDR